MQWITVPAYLNYFEWQITSFIEILIPIFSLYFVVVFLERKDAGIRMKLFLSVVASLVFIFLPTSWNIQSFDLVNCQGVVGPLLKFIYGFELLSAFWVFTFCLIKSRNEKNHLLKRQELLLGIGTLFFLLIFSLSNIFGEVTKFYEINLIGPIGMLCFIAILAYMIVKYQTFSMQMFATQVLVAGITFLIGSRLFYSTTTTGYILSAVTLIAFLISGVFLIRSVKKEIEQRERIEKLAEELQDTNERQETLIHFIGHEVKGFLTKDAGAFASLADGDFGALPEALKPFVTQALAQSRDGANSVTDILTASNQKKGTVSYTKEPFDLKALAEEMVDKAKPMAEGKGLELSISTSDVGTPYIFTGDKAKIGDNVFRNIIENSLNYTPSGTVTVSLKKDPSTGLGAGEKFIFAVKDTGIGITEEDKKRLFTEGGHGKDSQKVNVHSTGYGLYIAKNIIEAHGGTIRAESEGEGKGSTFVVELPA